jgi:ATP-dependent Clp protease ATP-binding subunit ClpC
MLLGIVDTPGKTKPTLDKYDISWSNVRRTLNSYAGGPSVRKPIRLADFKENKKMLPYSKTLQERLFHAGTISAAMGGTAIETEHVLLSLLRYQEVDGQVYAATRGDDSEAMEIIYNLDATLDGEDICNDLLQSLMETRDQPQSSSTPLSPGSSVDKEIAQLFKDGKVAADKKTNSSSLLDEFGIDLTRQARDGELEIVYGREEEIQNCLRVLLRRKKNNVCLIGDAGTGKSSVGEGLAQVLVSDECPALLKGYRMISLEVASLLSGTKFRGAFEERFRGILEEIASGEGSRTILFLDEMHTLMGSGSTEGSQLSPANLLKPYLAKGKIKVVGATTIVEYRSITKDAAMDRRFQPVLVREPSVNQTVDILNALLPFYSAHHRVEYDRESLVAAARLSDRYITDRFLPDKAIDLIDEAGALATLRRIPNEPAPVVDEELITEIVSDWSSIPVGALKMDETERLEALEANMGRRVIGQERAVKAVAKAIRRSRTGIRNPSRPIASFLFCGPTGTG